MTKHAFWCLYMYTILKNSLLGAPDQCIWCWHDHYVNNGFEMSVVDDLDPCWVTYSSQADVADTKRYNSNTAGQGGGYSVNKLCQRCL